MEHKSNIEKAEYMHRRSSTADCDSEVALWRFENYDYIAMFFPFDKLWTPCFFRPFLREAKLDL
jgi:hypothetical protein